ncbi:MAG: type II toxin-antitoxin system RelE family toxin [Cycloclasticus pugetii]|uniref:type II toxin-antitoxin system RelE family toxin n=1 Tax=Cycloclasticus pugetii TaxID=34068 RepID=UPI003A94FE72
MAWKVEVTELALKQLKKMGQSEGRMITQYLRKRIEPLDDPRQLGKSLKGELSNLWRYRVGDYRLICEINENELIVLVVRVGHRKGIYGK